MVWFRRTRAGIKTQSEAFSAEAISTLKKNETASLKKRLPAEVLGTQAGSQ
jgi:hypothetical protein